MSKSEKILKMIEKLKQLDDESLDQVDNAVNACAIVQNLMRPVNPVVLNK